MKPTEKKDAVLRMRMPESCGECPLCVAKHGKGYRCAARREGILHEYMVNAYADERPDWCPLEEVAWAPSGGKGAAE
jgi:hypothetical protein